MIESFCWINLVDNCSKVFCIEPTLTVMDVTAAFVAAALVVNASIIVLMAATIRPFDTFVSFTSRPISAKRRRMVC
jgi:hypothetical protein